MSNKSILITGASNGIGEALAWTMAKRGYDLALAARSVGKLQTLQHDIQQAHPQVRVEVAAMDVSDSASVAEIINTLHAALGKLDIVVANAGIGYTGKIGSSPVEEHLKVINTNVDGAIATLSAGLALFRQQGHGQLVGTSSVAAYRGLPEIAAYSASKAALSTFMEGVRAETLGENIDVTVLHPGYIDTDLNRDLPSRPFVIDVKKGAEIFAQLIERKAKRSTVPVFPWNIIVPIMARLPTSMIAKM